MKPIKALVIENCPGTLERVEDVLVALEHERDIAGSLVEARRLAKAYDYAYVLVSIEIPARQRGGTPSVANVENFLEYLAAIKNGQFPPVIVMSDRVPESVGVAVDMMRLATSLKEKGASDFIDKPFPTAGRTLDRVIKKVLGIPVKNLAKRNRVPETDDEPAPEPDDGWLSVTQAGELLMHDLPALDLPRARSRISTAASRDEFRSNGSRKNRRIEPDSFAAWRLRQRDRDLDEEDDDEA